MTRRNHQKYSDYKTTHLGWLRRIPTHWEVKRLKYLGKAIIGLTYTPDDVVSETEGTLVLRSSNIQNKQLSYEDNVYVKKIIPKKLTTQVGDILICARNGSRALIGKNAQIDKLATGVTFGAFMSIFRSPLNGYLSKVFNSTLFIYQSGSFLTSTINQLTTGNLNSFKIPLPPEEEQTQIASFLDHETAKIDTLIEKQQQLIKLLKEKRQAVISHAVTKGLNPDAPMRDSGVEWLGQVPAHWGMPKVSHTGRVLNGSTPDKSNELFWHEGTIPWLASSCLNTQKVTVPSALISKSAYESSSVELIPGGSLLVGMVGQGKTRGSSSILGFDSCINQNLAAIIPNAKINVKFLFHVFKAMYLDLRELGRGGNQAALNCEIIGSIRIPLPSIKEQDYIAKKIETQISKLDATSSRANLQIGLLQERRTALISAAVTGKIDVRNWKPAKSKEAQKT